VREAVLPGDVLHLPLEPIEKIQSTKTEKITELFKDLGYYHGSQYCPSKSTPALSI
jgi:hypothetical protein